MSKPRMSAIFEKIRATVDKHGPGMLTGMGIVGMIATTVMAVSVTPKALILIEEQKQALNTDELTPVEVVKAVWPCYIPATVTGCLSVGCLVCASTVSARRNSVLATAYMLSESALKKYQEKVIETIGEKKERAVRDAVAKETVNKAPVSSCEVVITEKGDTLCYDVISGRYFKSDIEKIKRAVNELNRVMLNEQYVSVNDFYYEIGLSNIKQGNDLGWNIADGFVEIYFSSHLADDSTPCLVLDYQVAPRYDYMRR